MSENLVLLEFLLQSFYPHEGVHVHKREFVLHRLLRCDIVGLHEVIVVGAVQSALSLVCLCLWSVGSVYCADPVLLSFIHLADSLDLFNPHTSLKQLRHKLAFGHTCVFLLNQELDELLVGHAHLCERLDAER